MRSFAVDRIEAILASMANYSYRITSHNLLVLLHLGERYLAVASFRKMRRSVWLRFRQHHRAIGLPTFSQFRTRANGFVRQIDWTSFVRLSGPRAQPTISIGAIIPRHHDSPRARLLIPIIGSSVLNLAYIAFDSLICIFTDTIVFRRKEALDATEEILSDNGIRDQYSPDITPIWNAKKVKRQRGLRQNATSAHTALV